MTNNAAPGSLSVAVVGAGAAGLVAARELKREGLDVTVFEQGKQLGGVWLYQAETEDDPLGLDPERHRVFSSMYKDLRTNLPRELMAFSDFPMLPATMQGLSVDDRTFCGHEEVQNYLLAFAASFDLEPLIQLNTKVVRALPLPAQSQHSPMTNGNADSSLQSVKGSSDSPVSNGPVSNGVVAASGKCDRTANGIHQSSNGSSHSLSSSHDKRQVSTGRRWQLTTVPAEGGDAEALREFDALVVCNGHFSEPLLPATPDAEFFEGRQMHSHNYRDAGPFAGQRVVVVGTGASGQDIGREIALQADRVYLSSKQWDPDSGPIGKRRNIYEVPAFKGFSRTSPHSVLFDCGQEVPDVDVVLYCTGYVYSFPFLEEANVIKVEDRRVTPLYQHVWPTTSAPSLSFIGLPWKVVPFPQYELQAKWVARVLAGRAQLPTAEDMQDLVDAFYAKLEAQGLEQRFTHRLNGQLQWDYNDWLAHQCGEDVAPTPPWRVQLYEETGQNRKAHIATYRDMPLNAAKVQVAHQDAYVQAKQVSV